MGAYLTLDEYKAAPTATEVGNLNVPGVATNSQDGALRRLIGQAGDIIRSYCHQQLLGGSRTETRSCRWDREGNLRLEPDFRFLVDVVSIGYGARISDLTEVASFADVWTEFGVIVCPGVPFGNTSSQGPIAFGSPRPGGRMIARYKYLYGWPGTALTDDIEAAATSIVVDDPTAVVTSSYAGPNTEYPLYGDLAVGQYTIYDPLATTGGDLTETVTVTAVNGNTLTTTPTAHAHAAGAGFSNLPLDVKRAAERGVSALIKSRGDQAGIVTNLTVPGQPIGMDKGAWTDVLAMRDHLTDYTRLR